jgi:hypothetical protein
VIVEGQSRIEKVVLVREKINGGVFELSRNSPTLLRLVKVDEIKLELV